MTEDLLHSKENSRGIRRVKEQGFVARSQKLCDGAELVLGACRNYFFPKHTHAEYTIGAVLCGVETIYCRGTQQHAGNGSLYFNHPDEIHSGQSLRNSAWKFASLYLSPEFFLECFGGRQPEFKMAVQESIRSTSIYLNFLELLRFSNCDMERQSALIAAVHNITKNNMVADLAENPVKPHPPAIKQAIDFMHAHFSAPIRLKDVADIAGFHRSYFVDCFAKTKGLTPHAYLLSLRLNAAKQALAVGYSPADVAVMSGFYDQSHLNRHFVKVFGMTSGQFRKQVWIGD